MFAYANVMIDYYVYTLHNISSPIKTSLKLHDEMLQKKKKVVKIYISLTLICILIHVTNT